MADGGGRRTAKKKNIFHPKKYYAGLTYKQKLQRRAEIKKFGAMSWKNPKAYVGFKTDKYGKTKRKSSYTVEWNKLFPDAKSLEEKSKVTGVPVKYLRTVFKRGIAAWRTGHKPFATQGQWGFVRSKSFLLCGRSHYTADSDQVRLAKKESASARKWFKRCKTSKLTRI
jgi:hypothetical protein